MKNKKAFRKAILPALAMLVASIVSLSSVTYAWFTAGTNVTVDKIDVNVEAAGGLQIATNAFNTTSTTGEAVYFEFGSNIVVGQLTDGVNKGTVTGVTLKPISTIGALIDDTDDVTSGKDIAFFKSTYDDTLDKISDITSFKNGSTESGYLVFDLYLKNPSLDDMNIDLTGTTVVSTSGKSDEAVRIAFINQGYTSSNTDNVNVRSSYSVPDSLTAVIYEPNSTSHTSSGIADYNEYAVTDKADDAVLDYKGISKASAATDYLYDRYNGTAYDPIDNSNVVSSRAAGATSISEVASTNWKVVVDSEDDRYENGVNFVDWQESDDYQAITDKTTALSYYNSKVPVYYQRTDTTTYTLVGSTFEWSNEADTTKYFTYVPVQLYQVVNDTVMSTVTTKTSTSETFITLKATTVSKITVYIWIEGQDADCENSIGGYSFSVNLKLNKKASA